MAFDFPASPAVGQVSNGYIWNGTAWIGNGNLAALAPPSDAAPSNPVNGQLWFESDTGTLWLWYVDVSTSQWVQIAGPGLGDAPVDGATYARKDGNWTPSIQDAPSDSKDYVRRNGVWVSARQKISLVGASLTAWTVPSWAKKLRFQGTLWAGNTAAQFPYLQFGVGGTFFASPGHYASNGFVQTSSTSAVVGSTLNSSQAAVIFAGSGDNNTVPWYVRGEMALERPNTGSVFAMDASGCVYVSGIGVHHGFYHTFMGGALTPALRLTDLRFGNSASVAWLAGSELDLEWF